MLHIHRSERADGLVEALGALLVEPLPDPFTPEVVAVPTRGIERWLTQRLSSRLGAGPDRIDGVCANIAFPSPRRLVDETVAVATGITPGEDPWLPERSVWPLLEIVDECLAEPWMHRLAEYLGGATDAPDPFRRARRLGSVRHLADLFGRYALHRPEMLRAWASGADSDGAGTPIPPESAWQAELWRRLSTRLSEPSPAERLENACTKLREAPAVVELPPRLALFGLTRLPTGHLSVLRALAVGRDVHLLLLHPSPALWAAVAHATELRPPIIRRGEDLTATLPRNRLLASWGQDAREMQLALSGGENQIDHHHPVESTAANLLKLIQAAVRGDEVPPGSPLPGHDDERPLLDAEDLSVQVHACHGRARQVEVVRDAILHQLEEDPSLEPRDVIVMCPDIETFAPLIQAAFGAGEVPREDELPSLPADVRPANLRVRLADRALRQTNPLLAVVAQLLDLTQQRVTASQLLDLADSEPVRRRFGLDDNDLTRMQDWVADVGIRWGLDAAHREPFKLDALGAGTWRAGLDRVLLGVTMTEDDQQLFAGVLPLDDVESGAIDLAGRFAEFVDRVRVALDALSTPKAITDWTATIETAIDALAATTERDAWQRAELQRHLDEVVTEATSEGKVNATNLELAEVRALLEDRLQGRPTRANFRTGHLTICTLAPMRSVPHQIVCLLGLDDGVFPRKTPHDGDDLMLDDSHVGERDPRTEDRQLLLDALLAATDRLIITFTGNDERTNIPRPPAVPVGELLDIVDATVRTNEGTAREVVVTRHPLQPFDPRNFAVGALLQNRSWSFDTVTLEGARALSGSRSDPEPFLARPLPAVDSPLVELESIVRFAQHPVRAFLRQRLGFSVGDFSDELEDDLIVELDGLEKWGVGQRLLDARLAGIDGRSAVLAEIARGTLPPGVMGQPVIQDVLPTVENIVAAAQALVAEAPPPGSVDVRVALSDGRLLSGTIPGVRGDVLLAVTYSRVAPKHRLAAWVRLLALTATYPDRPFAAATVGRSERGGGVVVARISPLAADAAGRRRAALGHLAAIVDLYDRGMREPLPLYCATSAAYAKAAVANRDPVAAGRGAWTSAWKFDKEDKELEHQLVLDGVRTFDELLTEPPRGDEVWDDAADATRMGRYAVRLWRGLLASEEKAGQ